MSTCVCVSVSVCGPSRQIKMWSRYHLRKRRKVGVGRETGEGWVLFLTISTPSLPYVGVQVGRWGPVWGLQWQPVCRSDTCSLLPIPSCLQLLRPLCLTLSLNFHFLFLLLLQAGSVEERHVTAGWGTLSRTAPDVPAWGEEGGGCCWDKSINPDNDWNISRLCQTDVKGVVFCTR